MSESTGTPSSDSSAQAKSVPMEEQHGIRLTNSSISGTTLEDHEKVEAARPSVASKDELEGVHLAAGSITYEKHEWHETLLRLGPLSGIAAFAVAILSICASLGVLAGSNHALVSSWPTPPSTYIAIFTAISNIAMRYAAIQGAIVGWWTRALQGGSSMRDLQVRWRAATSFHGALIAGRAMGWLGVASIVSCLVIVLDGPLLQRASHVSTETHQGSQVELQTAMYPEIPHDYTGALFLQTGSRSPAFNDTIPTPNGGSIPNDISAGGPNYFAAVLRVWASEKPLPGIVSGCPDKCSAKIIAPALAPVACSRRNVEPSYTFANDLTTSFDGKRAPPLDHDHFIIDTSIDVSGESEKINTVIAFVPTTDCSDDIQMEICSLQSAVGEYDITIENDKVTVNAQPRIVSIANNSAVSHTLQAGGYYRSTLGGIVSAAHLIWDSYVYVAKSHGFVNVGGAGAHRNLLFQKGTYNQTECPAWYDPTEEYRAALNKLMVYMGSQASHGLGNPRRDQLDPGLQINPTITGHIEGTRSVFHTDYLWFAGAAVVEFACICLIAPTYWGWWKIGRAVSFSPLEMANAFEAPMLDHVNSNSTGFEIARACSDQKVQYGSMNARYRGTKLAFSHPDALTRPWRDELIDA